MLGLLHSYNTNKIACGNKSRKSAIKDRAEQLLRRIKPFPKCSVAKRCMDHVGSRCERDDLWDAAIDQATQELEEIKGIV